MISIISSLYKSDRYLGRFQQALARFAQVSQNAGVDFELIVIANDPTARERQFEKEFKNESWFSFVAVGRESVFASFNRGFGLARGKILGFWNADDVRYASALVEAQGLFGKGAELVYFPFVVKRYFKIGPWYLPLPSQKIDRQIPEYNEETSQQFKNSMFCGPFFMFTKALYQKVGPFDEQFKIAGDFDWCVRAAHKTNKFVKAKSLGGIFRVDGGGLSAGTNPKRMAENNVVYMRNHVWDKLTLANDLIIKEYRVHHILVGGQAIKI